MLRTCLLMTFFVIVAVAQDGSSGCLVSKNGSCAKDHVLLQLPAASLSKKTSTGKAVGSKPHVALEYPSMLQERQIESVEAKPHISLADKAESGWPWDKIVDTIKDKAKAVTAKVEEIKDKIPVGGVEDHMVKDLIKGKLLGPAAKRVMEKIEKLSLPADVNKIEQAVKQHVPGTLVDKLFKGSDWKAQIQKILDGKGEVDTPDDAGAVGHTVAEAEETGTKSSSALLEADTEHLAEQTLPLGSPKDVAIKDFFVDKLLPKGEKGIAAQLKNLPLPQNATEIEETIKQLLPAKAVKKVHKVVETFKKIFSWFR